MKHGMNRATFISLLKRKMAAGDHLLYCGIAPGNQYGEAAA
jgi:hypothetical protein